MIYKFFDKLEDVIRSRFSHYPILYAVTGGIGIVLFWRGVWHTADYIMLLNVAETGNGSISLSEAVWWDGPLSFVVGTAVLLLTGLFVSSFLGNEIILSGLKGEKKISEKTEQEVKEEARTLESLRAEVREISEDLEEVKKSLDR